MTEVTEDEEQDTSANSGGRGSRSESVLRDTIRRAVERGLEAGIGTLNRTDKVIKGVVGGDLAKEVVSYAFNQIDDTKNALVRVVAREVREFLDATDIAHELQQALTTLSFEIKTEIRFIPNDSGGVKPDIKASVRPKRK
jgi:hypothetical protein